MKFTVKIPVTVEVDLDIDGGIVNVDYVNQDLALAVRDQLGDKVFLDDMVENITDYTGWCVNYLTLDTE